MTGLDRTINVIQKRTGAEVIFSVIHRHHLNKYELKILDCPEILSRLNQSSTLSPGETVLKFLEKSIYESPEQWYQWKKIFCHWYPVHTRFDSDQRQKHAILLYSNPLFGSAQ